MKPLSSFKDVFRNEKVIKLFFASLPISDFENFQLKKKQLLISIGPSFFVRGKTIEIVVVIRAVSVYSKIVVL